jgi:hypothetical protein
VAGVEHCNAGGKIQVAVPVNIPELGIFGPDGSYRRGVGDTPRNGIDAPLAQVGIGAHVRNSQQLTINAPDAAKNLAPS